MGQTDIWRGLEHEVRAYRSSVAFEQARERHEALRSYPDLRTATVAVAACRCEQRDAVVAAFLAEQRRTGARMWNAAAILAMAPLLASLTRFLSCGRSERTDDSAIVIAAFLEATKVVGRADRLVLRLYSETRRRVFRARRASLEHVARRAALDVDTLGRAEETCMEPLIDRARFVLRARTFGPEPGETLAAYVERLMPSLTRRERSGRRAQLSNQRRASLADLREAFRSITATQPEGESR
jgi:hypothetical protein